MARVLALDWDHQQLHVIAASTGSRLRVQHAQVWAEPQAPVPAEAEALGKHLRERLTAAGIAPGVVVACLGRERVILKEVRYPPASAADEPAVVRFQAAKELTDSADDVVIDYTPLGDPAAAGERRALALIVRKEVVAAYQTLCRAAGLKLLALTPRPFGTLACYSELVARGLAPGPEGGADAAVAVVTLAERWAEFCVLRGEAVLFTRALAPGPGLAGEVRRNLAVYAGQWPQHPVRGVCVAGDDEGTLRQHWQGTLSVPVHVLDPFAAAERENAPARGLGGFTAAAGLLYGESARRVLPINFARPKQPTTAADPNRRKLVFYGVAVAALLLGLVIFGYSQLALRDREYQKLLDLKLELDKIYNDLQADDRRFKALDDWTRTHVNWLDELFDMTDRIPDTDSLRLTELTAVAGDPAGRTRTAKLGRIAIKGISRDQRAIDYLRRQLEGESYFHNVEPTNPRGNPLFDRQRFPIGFQTGVRIDPRPPTKYVRQVEEPEEAAARRSRRSQATATESPDGEGGRP